LEFPSDKLVTMSSEEIGLVVNKALYHNDYEYQRRMMIPHPGKHLAEGLENIVYVCPHCQSINTIQTKNNQIRCTACGKEGFVDAFGFIKGFVFDNLIDWNTYQRSFTEQLRKSVITSAGILSYLNIDEGTQLIIGEILLEYHNEALHFSGALIESIPIDQVSNATITLRRDLGFLFDDRHFNIHLEHCTAAFLRILQDKY